jgi:hypothetical protein
VCAKPELQFFLPRLLLRRVRGNELFIEGEEVFDNLTVGGEGFLGSTARSSDLRALSRRGGIDAGS